MIDAALSSTLVQFAGAYGCMLVIPGPNALIVLQSSRDRSALGPVLAATGVAFGATLAAVVAASSARVLPQGPGFQALGSIVIAFVLFRAARQAWASSPSRLTPGEAVKRRSGLEPFVLGLGTALSNPMSVPYFAAFFVSHACTPAVTALVCGTVFTMACAWFVMLGLAGARVHRVTLPQACRRLANPAFAALLAGLATHQLWVAAFR